MLHCENKHGSVNDNKKRRENDEQQQSKVCGKEEKDQSGAVFCGAGISDPGYLISSKLRSSNQEERLSGIKVEKEVSVLLTELGYPGDDPTVAPADGWEWQEDEDPQCWLNPETGGRMVPVLKEDGTLDHWYYLSSHGKTYVIQEDGTYVPEE